MKLEEFTLDVVEPLVGSTFRIMQADGSPIELRLASVVPLMDKATNPRLKRKAFSIFFRGPGDTFLPQMMYTMHHETLGESQMFIVPVGRNEEGFEYEAVFT